MGFRDYKSLAAPRQDVPRSPNVVYPAHSALYGVENLLFASQALVAP